MAQPQKSNMVGMSAEGVRLVLQGSCGLTALDRRLKGLTQNEYTGGIGRGILTALCAATARRAPAFQHGRQGIEHFCFDRCAQEGSRNWGRGLLQADMDDLGG